MVVPARHPYPSFEVFTQTDDDTPPQGRGWEPFHAQAVPRGAAFRSIVWWRRRVLEDVKPTHVPGNGS